jgi:hypothetical protein
MCGTKGGFSANLSLLKGLIATGSQTIAGRVVPPGRLPSLALADIENKIEIISGG